MGGRSRLPTESSCTFVRNQRLGSGNLTVDGSGLVSASTGLGGFAASGSGLFFLRPLNMGVLADVAQHFEYWRLLAFEIAYEPVFRPVSTSATAVAPGVLMLAYTDDPDRAPGSAPSTGQLVDSKNVIERSLDEAFVWRVFPKSQFARLSTSQGTNVTSGSPDFRTSTAGFVTFATSIASTFVSGTIGRLRMKYWVSLSGSNPLLQTLSLLRDDSLVPGERKVAGEVKVASLRKEEPDYVVLASQRTTSRSTADLREQELVDYKSQLGSAARAKLGAGS
jgi:hypothetical protein